MPKAQGESSIAEIFGFFLRLGLTGFGGPAAHIALMEREAVERRGWVSREQFLDLVGGCNLLPGPSSTQVAMALGYTRSGWIGLVAAGACFILPASLATLGLAWAYVRYGHMPQGQGLLYGTKPVMVAKHRCQSACVTPKRQRASTEVAMIRSLVSASVV